MDNIDLWLVRLSRWIRMEKLYEGGMMEYFEGFTQDYFGMLEEQAKDNPEMSIVTEEGLEMRVSEYREQLLAEFRGERERRFGKEMYEAMV